MFRICKCRHIPHFYHFYRILPYGIYGIYNQAVSCDANWKLTWQAPEMDYLPVSENLKIQWKLTNTLSRCKVTLLWPAHAKQSELAMLKCKRWNTSWMPMTSKKETKHGSSWSISTLPKSNWSANERSHPASCPLYPTAPPHPLFSSCRNHPWNNPLTFLHSPPYGGDCKEWHKQSPHKARHPKQTSS